MLCIRDSHQSESPQALRQILGVVQEMTETVVDEVAVRALQVEGSPAELIENDRYEKLLKALNLRTYILSQNECLQLKKLLAEYQHVFALDNSELSSTSLVK